MAKYNRGDTKKFFRNNNTKANSAKIAYVLENPLVGKTEEEKKKLPDFIMQETVYIIEYKDGFTPTDTQKSKYDLSKSKTYLFAQESELS